MNRSRRPVAVCVLICGALLSSVVGVSAQQDDGYARSSAGIRMLTSDDGKTLKMLLDATNLQSDEIEIAEIFIPVDATPSPTHQHGAIEIFYVVEGIMGHVVNGEEHRLEPGMVGVVKPGDEVLHLVRSEGPVKTLVIWIPGGESDRRYGPPDADVWTQIRH